jgi:hypothetical protein
MFTDSTTFLARPDFEGRVSAGAFGVVGQGCTEIGAGGRNLCVFLGYSLKAFVFKLLAMFTDSTTFLCTADGAFDGT